MRKGKHVIGQPVLSFADGTRIDTVKDLLISETNDAIVALLVDEGGLLSGSRVVPTENVRAFGRDSIVVADVDSVVPASNDPEVKAILNRKDTLLGKRVVSDTGQAMGSVSDMYFDEATGRIEGFEVSGGLLGDMARGTSYLPTSDIERIGPDVLFIRPVTAQALEGQVGGVQGALQSAGDRIGEAGSRLGEATSQTVGGIQQGISQREPERGLIGRRSGNDVTDENGRIIVANGERIRAEHVEWAKETDNVGLLTRAATAGEAADAAARTGQALERAGDNVGAMWDRFTARLTQMRDEQGRQADAQQTASRLALIHDAIGRPVSKVILDRTDNVILDFGQIITHQAIQQAYDAGMLDTLLQNVYRAEVTLDISQLASRQPASATVEKSSGGATVVDELQQKVQETERERAERQERERQAAEEQRAQRERERQEKDRQREEAERQRQQEIAAATAEDASRSPTDGSKTVVAPTGSGPTPPPSAPRDRER